MASWVTARIVIDELNRHADSAAASETNRVEGDDGMLFETNPVDLSELVAKARSGKIQLPDFQRRWKWDDERIVSLLATVTLGYPLGVMMTLETGGSGIRFKPRPLDGTDVQPGTEPSELLMDGQQRLTSLFQALASGKPVDTMDARGKKLLRW